VSYLVLARKWRPQTFADLVGQEHVRRTLENAIAQDRVAHAFLFAGVRGVGKTTSARILAKTLNCVNGPTITPCLVCPACVEITAGNDVDVQEIDGASYTGIDDVRKLQEGLPYRPARDRFKILIVDEVHMLSMHAWNAFLKTLEEPPPHVKFIFATTEVHKVPITILSRCQRYDFKMIPAQTIAARVAHVLEKENIAADQAAISLVAREAAGSMRDAMSLLDQAIAWAGDSLKGDEVARVLGVASRSVLHDLAAAVVDGRTEDALRVVSQLVENGYDLTHVARDLLAQLRDLVVARVCTDTKDLLDMADQEREATVALAKKSSSEDLVRLHQAFSRSFDDIVRSGQPRAALEMVLVRLSTRPQLLPLDELVDKLGDLERRLGGGGGGGGAAPRGGPPGGGRPQASSAPQASAPVSGERPMRAAPTSSAPTFAPMARASSAAVALAPQPAPSAAPISRPAPPPAPSPSAFPSAPPANRASEIPRRESPEARGPQRSSARQPQQPTFDPAAPLPAAHPGVDMKTWAKIVDRVRQQRAPLAAVLELADPLTLSADAVVLRFPPQSFLAAQASEAQNTELLTRAVRGELGEGATLSIELSAEAETALTLARIHAAELHEKRLAARARVLAHPLVKAAMEALDATLEDVKLEA
jgi:DNA polymerase-3 subunit gamma/tau